MEWLLVFILGAAIGSFMNVLIVRTPRDESVSFPASHCMSCNTPLRPWHNIPIVSWLFLRGKCSFCGAPISVQYPIIETLSGFIFLVTAMKLGINLHAFGIATVFTLLLSLSVIDFYYKMVPDSLNLSALTFAILSATSLGQLGYNFHQCTPFCGRFYLTALLSLLCSQKRGNGGSRYYDCRHNGSPPWYSSLLLLLFSSPQCLALPALLLTRTDDEDSHQLPFIPFLAMATWIVLMLDTYATAYLAGLYG